jgi:Fic-DOC domain mobile mystery protein B
MSSHNFIDRDGATPIDEEQKMGLKFKHVTTMGELDELEDLNIQKGIEWLNGNKNEDYLSIHFLQKLHEKLFSNVWTWAGKFRKVEVNLSRTRSHNISIQLTNLFEDVKVWIKHGAMNWDEISAELHHRLVSIHPFPNGNGRSTRIFTEYVQRRNNQPVTSWKGSLKEKPKERRHEYINALKEADKGNYAPLISFMSEKK